MLYAGAAATVSHCAVATLDAHQHTRDIQITVRVSVHERRAPMPLLPRSASPPCVVLCSDSVPGQGPEASSCVTSRIVYTG